MKIWLLACSVILSAPHASADLPIQRDQSLLDAFIRNSSAATSLPCENGMAVTMHHNSADFGGQKLQWVAHPSPDSGKTGVFILTLISPQSGDWATSPLICTYADYPALEVQYWKTHLHFWEKHQPRHRKPRATVAQPWGFIDGTCANMGGCYCSNGSGVPWNGRCD